MYINTTFNIFYVEVKLRIKHKEKIDTVKRVLDSCTIKRILFVKTSFMAWETFLSSKC